MLTRNFVDYRHFLPVHRRTSADIKNSAGDDHDAHVPETSRRRLRDCRCSATLVTGLL